VRVTKKSLVFSEYIGKVSGWCNLRIGETLRIAATKPHNAIRTQKETVNQSVDNCTDGLGLVSRSDGLI